MSSLEEKDKRVNGLMSVGTGLYGMTHHNFGRCSRLHGNDGGGRGNGGGEYLSIECPGRGFPPRIGSGAGSARERREGEGTCETGFRRERGVLFAYSVRFSNNRQALVKTAVPRLDATI